MLGGPPRGQGSLPRDSWFLESRFRALSLGSLLAGDELELVLGALGGARVLERTVGPHGGLGLGPRTLGARGVLGRTGGLLASQSLGGHLGAHLGSWRWQGWPALVALLQNISQFSSFPPCFYPCFVSFLFLFLVLSKVFVITILSFSGKNHT